MTYEDLVILIPSHSLEDFPTDVGEDDAAGLLNAFAVVWHPVFLAEAEVLPSWHRADEPPETLENRLIIVPHVAEEWLPGGWIDHARNQGAVVISGISDRDEMLTAALEPLLQDSDETTVSEDSLDPSDTEDSQSNSDSELDQPVAEGTEPVDSSVGDESENETETNEKSESSETDADDATPSDESVSRSEQNKHPDVDPDLAADFLALGTCYLQIELLTRHMHHFSNFDEVHLQREAASAAKAALADDSEAARSHLKTCFELLTEARERFYPVECYLIDLCLLIPRLAEQPLETTLATRKPVNLLVTPKSLQSIADEKPELFNLIREAWDAGFLDIAGGEWQERATPLMPLESVIWDFSQGHTVFQKLFGRTPNTWGRRRFGFTTQMPQILNKFGYHSALHIALDDGIYPDAEQSKIRWEGSDGTVVDAITRIPLATDSASSYLRFAMRMAESMEEDQVAAVIMARWPEVTAPWFDDFRRIHKYSPTLGRFVTLAEFFDQTDDPGRLSTFEAKEYLSPFLIQSAAREEKDPISRYADHLKRRQTFDAACWYDSVATVLAGKEISEEQTDLERSVEQAGPDVNLSDEEESTEESEKTAPAKSETVEHVEKQLGEFLTQSSQKLTDLIMQGAGDQPGLLLLNSLSFPRTVSIQVPELSSAPEVGEFVKAVQFNDSRKLLTVKIPPCGFVWIPAAEEISKQALDVHETHRKTNLAEGNVLRNEFFEVHVNAETGGIERIKEYGRNPNRLSQQLAFRFPQERTLLVTDGEEQYEEKSYYSEMRCHSLEITSNGPALGEIVTAGVIVDQLNNSTLASFRQTFRIWRGRPVVEVETELDVETMPEGDPWTNYIASRFAWNDSDASLTRSVQQGAYGFQGERFESLHYFEIASDSLRTTILNPSSPFYRKTGRRMLDSLLIATGETQRRFRFAIAVDSDYPMQAALDSMVPVGIVPTSQGPPPNGNSGWFFHLNAKNVQILRIMGLAHEPKEHQETWEQHDSERLPPGNGFALRLLETEGRHRQVKLRCFKTPSSARQRDFQGRTITDLQIIDEYVIIEMTAYEIVDVEMKFDN
jgi:alpha-mannosidase